MIVFKLNESKYNPPFEPGIRPAARADRTFREEVDEPAHGGEVRWDGDLYTSITPNNRSRWEGGFIYPSR
jgi:hypothetical protein